MAIAGPASARWAATSCCPGIEHTQQRPRLWCYGWRCCCHAARAQRLLVRATCGASRSARPLIWATVSRSTQARELALRMRMTPREPRAPCPSARGWPERQTRHARTHKAGTAAMLLLCGVDTRAAMETAAMNAKPPCAADMPRRGTPPPPLSVDGNRLINSHTGNRTVIRGLNWCESRGSGNICAHALQQHAHAPHMQANT